MPFLLGLSSDYLPVREFTAIGDDGFFGSFSQDLSVRHEGQREVVTIYSGGALDDSFFPLENIYHEPISTLAGGQAITIFRKNGNFTIVKPASQGDGYTFHTRGAPAQFHCYLNLDDDAFNSKKEKFDYAVTDLRSGNDYIRGTELGVSRVFAKNHIVPVNIQIPPDIEDFTVFVGNAPGSGMPKLNVGFPHLIVGNDINGLDPD